MILVINKFIEYIDIINLIIVYWLLDKKRLCGILNFFDCCFFKKGL